MKAETPPQKLVALAVDTIKMLAVDAVEKANSGHPGMPMGTADLAFVLWTRYLRFNPQDPRWPNRDRFVLSAGHGSMLLYALLHLTGYDVSLEDLKSFRQWGSKTPGHPEGGHTPGVEVTTGPLGQGFANAVGIAIGERLLATQLNTAQHALYDHRTYCIAGDGDLMEGVSHEAASIAGHLGLGKLVCFYDDNHITLAGTTEQTVTDDVVERFTGYGWRAERIDGHDHAQVAAALDRALAQDAKPTLIAARTHIANGAPHLHDSFKAHGSPLGKEEVAATKKALGWPDSPTFLVPAEVRELFAARVAELKKGYDGWCALRDGWAKANPDRSKVWQARLSGEAPAGLYERLIAKLPEPKPEATRAIAGKIEQAVAAELPGLVGGSADLETSTNTLIAGSPEVQPGHFEGRNLRFGVREHAMGSIQNGLAQTGGFVPFGATFLVFSDYMRPAVRLAALGKLHTIYVWTHDSVLLGEDGPTHQPVEQLSSLRLIPGLHVFRPADALETAAAWAHAATRRDGPTGLVLTRQKVPPLSRPAGFDPAVVLRGGYVLRRPAGTPELVLLATGSEVHLAVDAAEALAAEGRRCQVVSLPCLELFDAQPRAWRDEVLPRGVRRLSIEAGRTEPWLRWVGEDGAAIGIDHFGASAPENVLAEKFGLTTAAVVARARDLLPAR